MVVGEHFLIVGSFKFVMQVFEGYNLKKKNLFICPFLRKKWWKVVE